MKALICNQYGGPEKLDFQTISKPSPKEDEILVKVHYAGLNFPDTLTIQGKDQYGLTLPFVPGREYSGEVVQTGENVSGFSKGDRVMVDTMHGAIQEYACSTESNTHKIPDSMSYQAAAAFGITYGTAYHALVDRGNIKSGESLAILGASGGVGSAALQIGKLLGAHVIACTGSSEKNDFCLELGADLVINYTEDDLKVKLKELTKGKGVDVVCDMVGAPLTNQAFRATAWAGRFLIIGFAGGNIESLPLNLPLLKGSSAVGVFFSTFASKFPNQHKKNISQLLKWVDQGELNPVIDHIYEFSDSQKAFYDFINRKVKGKVLIKL